MEEQIAATRARSGSGLAPFLIGLVAAIIVGWWLFPKALYSTNTQPLRFDHVLHVEEGGMLCSDCHILREDGSFAGLPSTEECSMCHVDVMGEDPAEYELVHEYIEPGKEIDWHVYQKQPDNVFFSHAVHSVETCGMCHVEFSEDTVNDLCVRCHPNVAEGHEPPPYVENRLTGYSKDTMKMARCEECHANENHREGMTMANNACQTCHK